ncbi:STING domain-containing protein [Sphaerospermopsis sp. LEGE 08334]|uniref:STING domain-containing protein n=1 Tax=Sphaerospermopsis sp. LEGE 08334 TaxID=1828651 RepID=UPI001882A7A3|nr:STING domain-containing protein [Sphaerospermopsis sp. LEGE 08334]MBE9058136.1 hypothetical protein [Sphaerospermopsis sp. LEGE 08334]
MKNIVFGFVFGFATAMLFNIMRHYLTGLGISAGDWLNFSAAMLAVIVSLWDKVPFLTEHQKSNSKLDEVTTITQGLAVGYFYNFLQDINAILENDIKVLFEDQTQKTFSRDQVEIQLVIPKRLNAASIRHARDSIKVERQADIMRPGRNFKINYALENDGAKLIIKDLIKPSFTIKEYMEQYLKLDPDTEEWRSLETQPLDKFCETINFLCNKSQGVAINQISWRKIE